MLRGLPRLFAWGVSGNVIKTLRHHNDEVRSVSFSPDGQWLVSGGEDALVFICEASTGLPLSVKCVCVCVRARGGAVEENAEHQSGGLMAGLSWAGLTHNQTVSAAHRAVLCACALHSHRCGLSCW